MAELHANLYVTHSDNETLEKLSTLFKTINDKPEPDRNKVAEYLIADAKALAPAIGESIANTVLDNLADMPHSIMPESRSYEHGYYVWHFVSGSQGDSDMEELVEFVGKLVPDADVRAHLHGDDDPWEIFYRFEKGAVQTAELEPEYLDEDEEQEEEVTEAYDWWHQGLPDEIKEGFVNWWKEDEEEE